MAIKKTVELDVNTKAGLKAMDELGLSFEEAFTEADNLSGQIGELEDALYAMAAAGQQNTKEYKELSQQVGVYKKVIIDTDMSVDALSQTTAQNLGGALGGVAAGFELGAGAMGAFGTESAVVEESLLKVASAMAIAQGLQGIREAQKSFKGLKAQVLGTAAATKIYNFVQNGLGKSTGVATKGMKLFRGALIATGIGALVVGVGMLIANFDSVSAWVKKTYNSFEKMGGVVKIITVPINTLIDAFSWLIGKMQDFGLIDSENTIKAKANAAERVIAVEKEGAATGKRYDYEISKANAAGKDTFKLEQQKRHASRKTTKEQIKAIKLVAKLNKETTEEQKKQIKELEEAILDSVRESKIAQIAKDKELNDERVANYKTHLAKKKAAENTHLSALREIKEHELSMIDDDFERERAIIANNFKIKREDLLANFTGTEDDKAELRSIYNTQEQIALEEAHQKKLIDLATRAKEENAVTDGADALLSAGPVGDLPADIEIEIEAEKIKGQALFDIQEQWRQKNGESDEAFGERKAEMVANGLANASSALSSLDSLNTALTDAAVAAAGDNEAAAEKARKKGFERSKKMQIGMAIITGIQGVMAAFTAGSSMGPAGVVMGPLMAGLAAATSIANIAKIAKTQYQSSGGGSKPDAGSSVTSVPTFNIAGNSTENQLAQSLGQQEMQPIKAMVVSTEVTTAQSLDRNKIDTATL